MAAARVGWLVAARLNARISRRKSGYARGRLALRPIRASRRAATGAGPNR